MCSPTLAAVLMDDMARSFAAPAAALRASSAACPASRDLHILRQAIDKGGCGCCIQWRHSWRCTPLFACLVKSTHSRQILYRNLLHAAEMSLACDWVWQISLVPQ